MPDETRYGFPRDRWERAKAQAETALVACGRQRSTTTYAALCAEVTEIGLRPYSFALVAFLDEICTRADEESGIVLASLVTRKDTGMPGEGYFRHARRTGHDISDRHAYWNEQVERVYSALSEGSTPA
jgi:hypothetical protein